MLFDWTSSENNLPNFYWGREGWAALRWYKVQLQIFSQSCFQFYFTSTHKRIQENSLLNFLNSVAWLSMILAGPAYLFLPLAASFGDLVSAHYDIRNLLCEKKHTIMCIHTHMHLLTHLFSILQSWFNSLSASLLYFWHSFLISLLLFSEWEEQAKINV